MIIYYIRAAMHVLNVVSFKHNISRRGDAFLQSTETSLSLADRSPMLLLPILLLLALPQTLAFAPPALALTAARVSSSPRLPEFERICVQAVATSLDEEEQRDLDEDEPQLPPVSPLQKAVNTANGLTKWAVVAAQTTAVVTRRDFASPYIVVGSIGASFAAHKLKKVINQQRPDGSPFIDPGMPSSHALVATFAAVAWMIQFQSLRASLALGVAAATVSLLRVATGCHTWAQILVGSGLGTLGGTCWMALGASLTPVGAAPRSMLAAMYATYVGGSVAFVVRKMDKWDWRK